MRKSHFTEYITCSHSQLPKKQDVSDSQTNTSGLGFCAWGCGGTSATAVCRIAAGLEKELLEKCDSEKRFCYMLHFEESGANFHVRIQKCKFHANLPCLLLFGFAMVRSMLPLLHMCLLRRLQ